MESRVPMPKAMHFASAVLLVAVLALCGFVAVRSGVLPGLSVMAFGGLACLLGSAGFVLWAVTRRSA